MVIFSLCYAYNHLSLKCKIYKMIVHLDGNSAIGCFFNLILAVVINLTALILN
ncbi:hypothetical protein A1OE_330 [Candidatus Endolissoclinum faulkneri L2]|uniref:Uncharacterized protein n=1 Tax=Candidatus Endolissoclinum faulkneri L2 TaxID=1193729 RepID=K7YM13_9PROT|nr:hypothetical protein A1OE_330 [Candidatus Endolissoclinum faulkneri L2]